MMKRLIATASAALLIASAADAQQGYFPSATSPGAAISGTPVAGNCASWLNPSTIQDAGQACGAGSAGGSETLVGSLIGANFNITTDQAIALTGPAGKWMVDKVIIANCTAALTNAKGTFYAASSKTNAIFGSSTTTTVFAGISANTDVAIIFLGNVNGIAATNTYHFDYFTTSSPTIYLSLSQGQGATATCDIYVYGMQL